MTGQLKQRVQSIDIVRGIIIIIMTLDHVRDFFHIHAMDEDPLAFSKPLIFFTRWVTHYCAPTFVFLSGVSAWLAGQKRTKSQLSVFLLKRGFWLILAEIILMSFAFTFNPAYNLLILEVLWAIGVSMIILGLLVWAPQKVIAIIGLVIFFGHNLVDYVQVPTTGWGVAVRILLSGSGGFYPIGFERGALIGYAPIPWAGVLLLGYTAGQLYNQAVYTAEQRRKILTIAGASAIFIFVVLRMINKYGNPSPWAAQQNSLSTILSFINTAKYPPSLDFLCMTLGPILILLAFIERVQNKFTAFVTVYGKVPFFYFIVHFFLVHTLIVIAFFASGYQAKDIVDKASPFFFRPQHFGFNIWIVYAIWLFVVLVMFRPCKWFNRLKTTKGWWWLSYT